ncbi:MAG: MATE family efflux transporter [Lachnospiraceae bacterium]|nr:MATE family efflux transporter [Lachnospiraceae bacterium]
MENDSTVKSMTEGRPLPLILKFMLPLLLSNVVQQTYNLVDAMIVGRMLGASALASVGASSSVLFLVLGFCGGSCAGFSIPVAQNFGAKDYPRMRSFIYHGILLTLVLAAVITLLTSLLCPGILHILRTPEDIYPDAYRYLLIIFLGIPFTFLYNYLSSILRAVGNSRMPFLFLTVSAVLNIFLDFFCVAVLDLGCAGAAIATTASQALSGFFCLIYICKAVLIIQPKKEDRIWKKKTAFHLLGMGIPMGIQFSITAIGSMVMQSANNSLGSICVSGFTAGTKIKLFTICPFDALATALATYVGQNYGARKFDRVKKGILQGMAVGVAYGIAAGIALILFGRNLASLFLASDSVEVLDAAAQFLRCLGYFYWMLALVNICRASVQALGYPGRAVFAGVIEMIARTSFSMILVPIYGYAAICYTDQSAWVTAGTYSTIVCLWALRKMKNR